MRQRVVLAAVLVILPLSACSRQEPPPVQPPAPALPDTVGDGARLAAERERARQDSIARARTAAEAEARRMAAAADARARAILAELVHFAYDDATVGTEAQQVLSRKVQVLRANSGVQLRVTGHADERGSVEYNLALGLRRSNSVRDYLAGFGLQASLFTTDSMGEDRPLVMGSTEAAWAQNRRAEFAASGGAQLLTLPAGM